jgi:lipopolysaccharide biosynthesis regulator YciM
VVNACQSSLALTTERLLAGFSQQCTSSASDVANDSPGQRADALQALMILHEKAERWADALSVGEALLRLKPADSELQKRVKKLASNARRR